MEKHSINEDLLQSYRSIFLSSQSILLAVGALLIEKEAIYLITIGIIAILQIWFIWYRVIFCRAVIVDYHKYKMIKKYSDKGVKLSDDSTKTPLQETTYVRNRKIRKDVNKLMEKDPDWKRDEKFRNIRHTRFKLDVVLPLSLTAIWILLMQLTLK